MNLREFIDRVIEDGIVSLLNTTTNERKQQGGVAGFNACRDKSPPELLDVLSAARLSVSQAYAEQDKDYWWYRFYEAQVEWVCNCVSAVLMNQGLPILVQPTARGVLNAQRILQRQPV